MNAVSQYLESGLLNHLFCGTAFPQPSAIYIALTSGVPSRTDNGASLTEIPTLINSSGTGYSRLNLFGPASGAAIWDQKPSGDIANHANFVFNTALLDWGWVSGLAIVDSPTPGSGNVLMFTQLDNPRVCYMGDSPAFAASTFDISFS